MTPGHLGVSNLWDKLSLSHGGATGDSCQLQTQSGCEQPTGYQKSLTKSQPGLLLNSPFTLSRLKRKNRKQNFTPPRQLSEPGSQIQQAVYRAERTKIVNHKSQLQCFSVALSNRKEIPQKEQDFHSELAESNLNH